LSIGSSFGIVDRYVFGKVILCTCVFHFY